MPFLSHKAEMKKEVAALRDKLESFGVSSFVAHMDIRPTKPWQDEIESALASMDGFAALLTDKFHESDWTDQEVGFALARGVPLVAVRMGRDPYGFMGKFQALTAKWDTCPAELVKLLIKHDRMFSSYVRAIRKVASWATGNELGKVLVAIEDLNQSQIDSLVAAYNETNELRSCWAFNGQYEYVHGTGLPGLLRRLGVRNAHLVSVGEMDLS